jgi:lipid A 4'-phosphatase
MTRSGLMVALAIAAVVGLVFGLYPDLDLRIAGPLYDYAGALRFSSLLGTMRRLGLWVAFLLVMPAVAALVIKLILPKRKLLISGRAIVFLIATLALAPGLMANVVLKEHWGRPRPSEVSQFGGNRSFVAWWDPRGGCPSNCSFVSGDVSGAFWTLAPAALAPPPWRALAYGGALALGTAMAVVRMMAGAHFFSDTVFAGVFTFLIIWIAHGLIYRWPRTRLTDDGVERAVERIAAPGNAFIVGLFGKRKSEL